MNIKKILEQEAKSTHQQILEEGNKNFLPSLQERVSEPERKPLFRHWKAWTAGTACTVAAALIVVCSVMFIPNNKHVVYYEENFQTSESDVATLNADLKEFQIDLGDNFVFSNLKRTIDGLSGDLLFYEGSLYAVDNSIQTYLTLVCNQNYECDLFSDEASSKQVTLPHYSVSYYIQPPLNAFPQQHIIQASAKVQGTTEIIYITNYREIALDENGTLLEFIQDLIQVKE